MTAVISQDQARLLADLVCSLPGEVWRSVVGYEQDYAVSSMGRIFSRPRLTTPGGILRQSLDNFGYKRLALVSGGKQRTRRVHLLVMEAFNGPTPDGLEVRHLDGNAANPELSNLAFGTHSENGHDSVRHGTNYLANRPKPTHCIRGHAFDEANTGMSRGARRCRRCAADEARRRYVPKAQR